MENIKYILLAIFITGAFVTSYGGEVNVQEEIRIRMTPAAAWAIVGGFQSLDRWHPAAISSESTGTGLDKGDIRILTLGDNSTVIEVLENYDNDSMTYSYKIIDSPLPIANYVSQIQVKEYGRRGKAKVIWSSSFDAVGVSDEEAAEIMSGVYVAGLEYLRDLAD